MQFVFHATVDDRVPRIIPALAAHNDVGPDSQHVDDLALAFVAPLHPN